MNTKKTAFIITAGFIFTIAIACANLASAAEWEPLVRIPGLPPTGTVNLSMYLIGLYNFLLSIVGIVAVMMLIIGGMRYITAVGNPTAIGDAKDIISNAILGLLLALLSWVFISTINPDALYIKPPGSGIIDPSLAVKDRGSCYTSYDVGTGTCVCEDGYTVSIPVTDDQACTNACKTSHCNSPLANICIMAGSPVDENDPYYSAEPYNSRCQCIDDIFIAPAIGVSCQDTCAPSDCGWKFLVAKLDAEDYGTWEIGENIFHLNSDAELWELFLTNDGTFEDFNVTATSYTVGLDTYNCAVLALDEDTFGFDEYWIYWVKPGVSIKSDGKSFKEDVENSGIAAPQWAECCDLSPSCAITGLAECKNDPFLFTGPERIWYSRYSAPLVNKCGNCSFSKSETEFHPNSTIKCVLGPTGNGFWQKK